ncbi:hypothetical protein D915_002494 [Fasciola hepatica]|uniref:Uncharacterized protein n=1 Tax=Fasciola hepatica TaxID=6192 RepID=A0A2H1CMD9_FASHE|nr:hypothetical protein D915_002494 [Fasciola hepatica]
MRSLLLVVIFIVFSLAVANSAERDPEDYAKRAYHFFRIRRGSQCLPILDYVKLAMKNPRQICEEDRAVLESLL